MKLCLHVAMASDLETTSLLPAGSVTSDLGNGLEEEPSLSFPVQPSPALLLPEKFCMRANPQKFLSSPPAQGHLSTAEELYPCSSFTASVAHEAISSCLPRVLFKMAFFPNCAQMKSFLFSQWNCHLG